MQRPPDYVIEAAVSKFRELPERYFSENANDDVAGISVALKAPNGESVGVFIADERTSERFECLLRGDDDIGVETFSDQIIKRPN
jgi:hypothetical protein